VRADGGEQVEVNPSESAPSLPQGASVNPSQATLSAMNESAATNSSPVNGLVVECPVTTKVSWFAIRVVDDKNVVVEGLTLKMKITGLGDTERITSKAVDPIKIEQLTPGGTGEVLSIETEDFVWEAVGDIT
jgi:hypothetical protein